MKSAEAILGMGSRISLRVGSRAEAAPKAPFSLPAHEIAQRNVAALLPSPQPIEIVPQRTLDDCIDFFRPPPKHTDRLNSFSAHFPVRAGPAERYQLARSLVVF